jgi:hypothetical protein
MSKYGIFETTIRDERYLCAALDDMGFKYEVHSEAQPLYGYGGDQRNEKANIIIRRQNTGISASNDIGFSKQPDGTYQAVISAYDHSAKFDDTWMGKLKQGYTVQRHMAVARAKGHVLLGREVVKGKVMLRFGAR